MDFLCFILLGTITTCKKEQGLAKERVSLKYVTYSEGWPIRNSCLVKVQMLQVRQRGESQGGRVCVKKK